jgi:hypothetical protein
VVYDSFDDDVIDPPANDHDYAQEEDDAYWQLIRAAEARQD